MMTMPYSKSISFFACLLSLTGLYGCQSAQQKVYQQASRSSADYQSTPYSQMEPMAPGYQSPDRFLHEPAPAPVDSNFPPAAPPSLFQPEPEKQSNEKVSLIRKTSQEQDAEDQEYFKSVFSSEPVEPAQKHLGLVPRYSSVSSSVSQKMKHMNGKVKDFYSKVKSKIKTPQWIRKVSDTEVEVQEVEIIEIDDTNGELSCIESTPYPGQYPIQANPVFPEPIHPQPQQIQPQPDLENKGLPLLPPPGEATNWDDSWRVSATLEELPAEDYSTVDDEIEWWPHSKQRMQQAARVKHFHQLKTATPVSSPPQLKRQIELTHPRELSVPPVLSQEDTPSIRKIGLQRSQNKMQPLLVRPSNDSPYTPLPKQAPARTNY